MTEPEERLQFFRFALHSVEFTLRRCSRAGGSWSVERRRAVWEKWEKNGIGGETQQEQASTCDECNHVRSK